MQHQFAQQTSAPALNRKPAHREDDPLLAASPHQLVQLQHAIGNSGVRAMLARQSRPAVQRLPVIQRWGDDEETESGGGGWFDQASDAVSGWIGGGGSGGGAGTETVSGGGGGGGGAGGGETGGGEDKSWWQQASDEVGSWFGGDSDQTAESEGEDGGGIMDWLPDIDFPPIFGGEADEDMPTGEIELSEIESVVEGIEGGTASCVSGHGGATGGGVSVAGKTSADFQNATAAASLNNPKINKRKDGNKTVYDVTGTVHIDYALPGEPSVSYVVNPPKDQLSDCKKQKVDAFIAGDLGTHEAEHVAAFKTFNGAEDHSVSFTGLEASSTAELTQKVQAKVDDFVKGPSGKVKDRQSAAQAASDAKDQPPWSKPIPGIDSCP